MATIAIKRPRGRPRKSIAGVPPDGGTINGGIVNDSGGDVIAAIDPDAAIGHAADSAGTDSAGTDSAGKRRRGRPSGKAKTNSQASVSGIESTLLSIHQMGAAFFAVPELALENGEAKALAEAIAEVNRHYHIPGLRPDHAAVVSLAVVVFVTYGKRVPVILARQRGTPLPQRQEQAQQQGVASAASPMPDVNAVPWFPEPALH